MNNNLEAILYDEGLSYDDLIKETGLTIVQIMSPTRRQIKKIISALNRLTKRKYTKKIVFPNN